MSETASPSQPQSPLLGQYDPPAYEILNRDGSTCLLLVCDHASRAVPSVLGQLGLGETILSRHIAWDIGAASVCRRISDHMSAPAVLAGYSRLLIDCNRQPGHPQSVPPVSDGVSIPGNQGLSEDIFETRIETFFRPYHNAITSALAHMWHGGKPPALLSIHSFTPNLNGEQREWDIGVLWNRDPRLARPLMERLRSIDDLKVGDNEPYSGTKVAYTIDRHAGAAGLPNCAVEIRQDHLGNDAGIERWASLLSDIMSDIIAIPELHRVEHY